MFIEAHTDMEDVLRESKALGTYSLDNTKGEAKTGAEGIGNPLVTSGKGVVLVLRVGGQDDKEFPGEQGGEEFARSQ